jgi:hypothetical protein
MTVSINANPGQVISLVLNANDGYNLSLDFIQEILPVNTNGQVAFTLSQVPSSASSVIMFVNGVQQVQTVDYSISSNNVIFLNNGLSLITTDIVDFYYSINATGSISDGYFDGYVPTIDSIYYPNGTLAAGFPQNMVNLAPGIYKYNLTLPKSIVGTFIAISSFISSNSNFIQKEVFLINVSTSFGGNAYVSPG